MNKLAKQTLAARQARLVPPPGCETWLMPRQLVDQYGSTRVAWWRLIRSGQVTWVRSHGVLWVSPESAEAFIRDWSQQPRGRGRPRTLKPPRGKSWPHEK